MKKKLHLLTVYNHLEELILVCMFAVMVIVIFVQVIMRFVFNNSLSWSEALARLLFVWLTWLGVSIGAREGEHIKITAITEKLPRKAAQIVNIISEIAVIGICAVTIRYGVQLCDMLWGLKAEDAALHISQVWGYAAVPVGCGLQIFRSIVSIVQSARKLRTNLPMYGRHQLEILVLFATLFLLIVIGVPVGFAIGGATIIALYYCTDLDMVITAQYCYSGVNSFTILSIPFFMLAGSIMSTGGIAKRIVAFAKSLIGAVTGGLGAVAVLASCFFGAISGSGMATTSAIGGMLIPEMRKEGYDVPYSTTLICFAGTVGPIIPPSISFIMYGVVTGTSISDLFIAGVFPGLLMGLGYLVMNWYMSRKYGFGTVTVDEVKEKTKRHVLNRLKAVGKATWEGKWALLSPVIILGGIYSGIFTPTEAACVSVVYSVIVSLFVYREMTLKDIYKVLAETAVLNGITSFMLAYSTVFSTFLNFAQIPTQIYEAIIGFTDSKVVFLLIVNLVLLVIGCFVDSVPAMVVMAPLLLPAAESFGLNPVHFGIIMSVNLAIGLCTPPYGCNLFVGTAVGRIKMESMFKFIPPFFVTAVVALLLITFVPQISLLFLS